MTYVFFVSLYFNGCLANMQGVRQSVNQSRNRKIAPHAPIRNLPVAALIYGKIHECTERYSKIEN
jgi:hypothetical protein